MYVCVCDISVCDIVHLQGANGGQQHPEGRVFPSEDQQDEAITCLALTQEFLIYGTEVSV